MPDESEQSTGVIQTWIWIHPAPGCLSLVENVVLNFNFVKHFMRRLDLHQFDASNSKAADFLSGPSGIWRGRIHLCKQRTSAGFERGIKPDTGASRRVKGDLG
jgi:hypothetical protein